MHKAKLKAVIIKPECLCAHLGIVAWTCHTSTHEFQATLGHRGAGYRMSIIVHIVDTEDIRTVLQHFYKPKIVLNK